MSYGRKVRWGILGTGKIANQFASDFGFVSNGQLIAVASRTDASARQFAHRHAIPRHYGSYQDLCRDPEIDAVYIATPHHIHFENSQMALTNGKAVLCEKPICTSPLEFDKLRLIAQKNQQYLMEAMWTYFLPAILKMQAWIADGRIGELVQVKADFGYHVPYDPVGRMYNPKLAGGALLDMGIYPIAMACLLIDTNPNSSSVMVSKAANGVDDAVDILFEYDQQSANLATSFKGRLANNLLVIGTRGTIEVPQFWKAKACSLFDGDQLVDHFQDDRPGLGYHFECTAASNDIPLGRLESDVVPHAMSARFQEIMELVRSQF